MKLSSDNKKTKKTNEHGSMSSKWPDCSSKSRAKAANSGSNPASIQITQREDNVADFKKEVASKNLKLAFKLEGSSNYDAWRDET